MAPDLLELADELTCSPGQVGELLRAEDKKRDHRKEKPMKRRERTIEGHAPSLRAFAPTGRGRAGNFGVLLLRTRDGLRRRRCHRPPNHGDPEPGVTASRSASRMASNFCISRSGSCAAIV